MRHHRPLRSLDVTKGVAEFQFGLRLGLKAPFVTKKKKKKKVSGTVPAQERFLTPFCSPPFCSPNGNVDLLALYLS
jgi:hypothetical protein